MKRALLALGLAIAAVAATAGTAMAGTVGAVYVQTNNVPNAVKVFYRGADGQLTAGPTVPTGGAGSLANLPLGLQITDSQNSVMLTPDNRVLLVTNNGSNTVSSFRVLPDGNIVLADQKATNGIHPNSIGVTNGGAGRTLAYVLNSYSETLQGFTVDRSGTLTPIAGSSKAILGGNSSATVDLNHDGSVLTVTNRNDVFAPQPQGTLSSFSVDKSTGILGPEHVIDAVGTGVPFGLDFTKRDDLAIVASNGQPPSGFTGSVSTYHADKQTGTLAPTFASPSGFITCWSKVTNNDQWVYVTSAGPLDLTAQGTIQAYHILPGGALTLVQQLGPFGESQLDEDTDVNSQYLYVLAAFLRIDLPGFPFENSQVEAFKIDNSTGQLTLIGTTPFGSGGNSGLASY